MVWKCSERRDPPAHARQVESGREVGVATNGDCTSLFSGFCNFYSGFLQGFSKMASAVLEKLKVGRVDGKKGSKFPLTWSEDDKLAFETLKRAMLGQMSL